ncbi:hypothetical protein IVB22_24370 [Bradyrhizobium sp. 190]|uniref:hypothetical protein n=1 Tax=Bradyrhizobium sp. 190 TaxID=2782658 RepID=UPI001FF8AE50|nr:hypothetical protein [Bradyrhizobium sp. 190]MCK1515632.1 hypothetical protein [Bradyrhizobium sp. 190]
MAFKSLEFFHSEKGMGDEQWFSLILDRDTGAVAVLHETSLRHDNGYKRDTHHIELEVFLNGKGTPQDKLRALIGSLVKD